MYDSSRLVPHAVMHWRSSSPSSYTIENRGSRVGSCASLIHSSDDDEEWNEGERKAMKGRAQKRGSEEAIELSDTANNEEKQRDAPLHDVDSLFFSSSSCVFDLPWSSTLCTPSYPFPYVIRREPHALTVYELPSTFSSRGHGHHPVVLLHPHRRLTCSTAWQGPGLRVPLHQRTETTLKTIPTPHNGRTSERAEEGKEEAANALFVASGDTRGMVQVVRIKHPRRSREPSMSTERKALPGGTSLAASFSSFPTADAPEVVSSFTLLDVSTLGRGRWRSAPVLFILPPFPDAVSISDGSSMVGLWPYHGTGGAPSLYGIEEPPYPLWKKTSETRDPLSLMTSSTLVSGGYLSCASPEVLLIHQEVHTPIYDTRRRRGGWGSSLTTTMSNTKERSMGVVGKERKHDEDTTGIGTGPPFSWRSKKEDVFFSLYAWGGHDRLSTTITTEMRGEEDVENLFPSFASRATPEDLGIWMANVEQAHAWKVPVSRHPSSCDQPVRCIPIQEAFFPSGGPRGDTSGASSFRSLRNEDPSEVESERKRKKREPYGEGADDGDMSGVASSLVCRPHPPVATITSLCATPAHGDAWCTLHQSSTLAVLWSFPLRGTTAASSSRMRTRIGEDPSQSAAVCGSFSSSTRAEYVQSVLQGRGTFDIFIATTAVETGGRGAPAPLPPRRAVWPSFSQEEGGSLYHFDVRYPSTPVAVYPVGHSSPIWTRHAMEEEERGAHVGNGKNRPSAMGSPDAEPQDGTIPHPVNTTTFLELPVTTVKEEDTPTPTEDAERKEAPKKVLCWIERWKKKSSTKAAAEKEEGSTPSRTLPSPSSVASVQDMHSTTPSAACTPSALLPHEPNDEEKEGSVRTPKPLPENEKKDLSCVPSSMARKPLSFPLLRMARCRTWMAWMEDGRIAVFTCLTSSSMGSPSPLGSEHPSSIDTLQKEWGGDAGWMCIEVFQLVPLLCASPQASHSCIQEMETGWRCLSPHETNLVWRSTLHRVERRIIRIPSPPWFHEKRGDAVTRNRRAEEQRSPPLRITPQEAVVPPSLLRPSYASWSPQVLMMNGILHLFHRD